MTFSRGDTFLMGPLDEYHLNVVVTDPTANGEVVIVPVTTLRPRTRDRLFILNEGDHPFIKHPSAIACSFAQISLLGRLLALAASKTILPREPLPKDLAQRIAEALLESDFTENGVKHFLREGR